LPTICRFEAALPRTAVKAALRMRLPRTITLSARKTLTALPHWPDPPALFITPSMRLSTIRVPSARCAKPGCRHWGSANRVAENLQPPRIDRENGGIAAADGVGVHFALNRLERNA